MKRKTLIIIMSVILVIAVGLIIAYTYPSVKPATVKRCSKPALIYVYDTDEQKKSAQNVISFFKKVMLLNGISLENYTICYVSKNDLGYQLRLYPIIVFKGGIDNKLKNYTSEVNGIRVLNPVVDLAMLRYIGVKPTFTIPASAIIITAKNPLGEIKINKKMLKEALSVISIANITEIKFVNVDELRLGIRPYILPYIVFKSDYNLSQGVAYLESIGGKYYKISDKYALRIAFNVLGVQAVDFYKDLNSIPITASIGSKKAMVKLYIFEDVWCPYCAKFYLNGEKTILSFINEGKLEYNIVDFIVHRDATEIHALLRCMLNKVKDENLYFKLVAKLYIDYAKNITNIPTYNKTLKLISEAVNSQTLVDDIKKCVPGMTKTIVKETESLRNNLGIEATPTIILSLPSKNYSVLIEGYIEPSKLKSLIEWLISLAGKA
ncbi:MAG: thioredoxin domain-containing protein [Pyrodictiaceae archaeon]